MIYIAIGALGFLIIHLFDIISLRKIPASKPLVWTLGSGLLIFSIVMVCLVPDRLILPLWSNLCGYVLLGVSILFLLYSLFINLPFRKTYIASGVSEKLITTGLYALVRHPGVHWFILILLSLFLVTGSKMLIAASVVWILMDILLVVIQDRFFFGRMFEGYDDYRQTTPMLVPNRKSISAFISYLTQAGDRYPA